MPRFVQKQRPRPAGEPDPWVLPWPPEGTRPASTDCDGVLASIDKVLERVPDA